MDMASVVGVPRASWPGWFRIWLARSEMVALCEPLARFIALFIFAQLDIHQFELLQSSDMDIGCQLSSTIANATKTCKMMNFDTQIASHMLESSSGCLPRMIN
jgi:hypothetical protein